MFAIALRTWSGLHGIGKALVLLAVGLAVAGSVWLARPLVSRTTIDEAPPRAGGTATPLASGAFTRVDSLHAGEGVAAISRDADGQLVLRLEGFSVTNGPDLFVALSGHPAPRASDEAHADGYLELARLKASQGNQNYQLPADLDLSRYRSVVIYCRAFSVVFSTATLQ